MQYGKPAIKAQVSLEGSLAHGENGVKPIRRGSGRVWEQTPD